MKYKLRSLTGGLSLLIVLTLVAGMVADDDAETPQGNDLIEAAASNLAQLPSLEAKLRQRVRLFGHEMVGSGTYQQFQSGTQRLLRLELKMDVAGKVNSFQQVSDGTTLWIRRDTGDAPSLEYINLRQLRQALARSTPPRPTAATGNWFALGGLDQLLSELSHNFDFAGPTPSEIGTVPVWEVTGTWNAAALEQLEVTSAGQLPRHLPDSVKVTLGRDQQLPLFLYRIEYARNNVAIVAMDLHGVHRRPDLVARHFRFQPNDQEVVDVTDRYLSRLVTRRETSAAQ